MRSETVAEYKDLRIGDTLRKRMGPASVFHVTKKHKGIISIVPFAQRKVAGVQVMNVRKSQLWAYIVTKEGPGND